MCFELALALSNGRDCGKSIMFRLSTLANAMIALVLCASTHCVIEHGSVARDGSAKSLSQSAPFAPPQNHCDGSGCICQGAIFGPDSHSHECDGRDFSNADVELHDHSSYSRSLISVPITASLCALVTDTSAWRAEMQTYLL